ncbi:MauE/DoxX family redox-associated membrane protein [Sphingobacterium sp. IITKGP-BTPF85]|uniref:MauE/DoxX family redox-associated membrane protein n=1 Tax=Sphingobacterium sp. IITKGP-BTPF85 TaxID=1338009 RepID=UPI00038A2A84|nr:MauE/DoxX family redox-associated membrane protein [Sphingobacterium sp. IITKGP-BTPF85]KKX47801.1 hypothetical protein L950_0224510 [Sphingobacterium sp. IITKGP-BTPF85]
MDTNKNINIIYGLLRIVMLLFWIYVGIDKVWQLHAFKIALTQQPIISYFAPVLFWLLPVLEVSLGLLLAFPSQKVQSWGWKASILLISVFTVYTALGVLDVYEQKPCMCSSFLSNVSWNTHLVINSVILALSILGKILNKSFYRSANKAPSNIKTSIILLLIGFIAMSIYTYNSTTRIRAINHWHTPESLYYQEHNTVMSPLKGLLASTYDRYLEPYRQFFTKGLQAATITNPLLVCNTERRIAVC